MSERDASGRYHDGQGRYRAETVPTEPMCSRCGLRPPAAIRLCGPCLAQEITDLKAELVAAQAALNAAVGPPRPTPQTVRVARVHTPPEPAPSTWQTICRWLRFE